MFYQYQCVCKIIFKYSLCLRVMANFHIFTIWTSAKPRPQKNDILQSPRLAFVKINVYGKFHQHIPYGSGDRASFISFRIWTSAKPRPMKKSHLPMLWARYCQYQCVCKFLSKYFSWLKSYGQFSQTDLICRGHNITD